MNGHENFTGMRKTNEEQCVALMMTTLDHRSHFEIQFYLYSQIVSSKITKLILDHMFQFQIQLFIDCKFSIKLTIQIQTKGLTLRFKTRHLKPLAILDYSHCPRNHDDNFINHIHFETQMIFKLLYLFERWLKWKLLLEFHTLFFLSLK